MTDLAELFQKPTSRHHKRYEILRAAFVENLPLRTIGRTLWICLWDHSKPLLPIPQNPPS